ncbi:uncharacterized protein LOC111460587 [Cucurbita moschata]|uniref:Uncharacterized protein LOC111460587 n=1 Tax=Cucurbita moschata TaxID=3662 RepID=A0A6J1H4T7_CUCMO|nr:uncharacterized protein LOC111460587 [Cucurbita moschata]XP_022959538.1 uncharacterized protein LOC111460587 [Cucurbita moschata]XP_022959539.1 uncharacterized protein LOC111460587 [Cucurbita moschata]XP_022959540.1 uncharacterized protein LOC111460587 [Cucurbita moschata]XP_022959541.1 uncharacterized protein LOC111460587 [Cucurbita moschata]XP_022959542.1 uncharacterized protein LOC111460587 [Cucurbita moschata]XP_022959543.1 uncharacterized protein LOC111460587 [Cucurbita moschata]XP_0
MKEENRRIPKLEKMSPLSSRTESQISPESAIGGDPEPQIFPYEPEFSSEDDHDESVVLTDWNNTKKKNKKKNQILLEGFVEVSDEENLTRTKSLTDDDLEELKGCVDLGFAFCYDEIPELCNTLPALELCYSMSQKFMDDHQNVPEHSPPESVDSGSSPIPNWKISSPGDHPEDVKARLKYWAQAVACTVRLCN